jgi:3-carboxy-cis,cis-muconate cycloisomerase
LKTLMSLYSTIFEKYLSHPALTEVVSDRQFIHRMVRFEIGLAKCQANVGIVPVEAGEAIQKSLNNLVIDPKDLTQGTLADGVPTVALLEQCRLNIPPAYREYLHHGATSQDVIDSAMVLMMKESSIVIDALLNEVIRSLDHLQQAHGELRCMLRTRRRSALPGMFGTKIRAWRDPLERQRAKLEIVAKSAFKIQLGGPVGDGQSFGSDYNVLLRELAIDLGLESAPAWHAQRDSVCEFSGWLSVVAGIAGKIGSDIIVMARNEVGEVSESTGNGGKSSSMPHKRNPVRSEALVAIARIVSNLQAQMLQSLVHELERDGSALIQEWITLPQMILLTGCALEHARFLAQNMNVNADSMEKNVKAFLNTNKPNP